MSVPPTSGSGESPQEPEDELRGQLKHRAKYLRILSPEDRAQAVVEDPSLLDDIFTYLRYIDTTGGWG